MIPNETLARIRKTIRRIELTTRKVVEETLAGQYHSVFKGRGIEFSEVREYVPGDDVRTIDWNVTSRMGSPFTKQFTEERELTVLLAVDASASMDFGSSEAFKNRLAAEISALLAFAAIKNNDRVGLVIFTDGIELHIRPKKGRRHVLRIVRDVLFFKPRGRGSGIGAAVEYLNRTQRKKAVIFLISDFLDRGFHRPLQLLARKHDVVAVRIIDPREESLAGCGLIRLADPETGDLLVVDTSSRRWRRDFQELRAQEDARLERFFKANGIDHLDIDTRTEYDKPIVDFFRKRARRRR